MKYIEFRERKREFSKLPQTEDVYKNYNFSAKILS